MFRVISRILLLGFVSLVIALGVESGPVRASSQINTTVCGTLSGNPVWSPSGGDYLVTCVVEVPQGHTLTIQSGVTVKFSELTGLEVHGSLNVNGTSSQPVVFTSANASPHAGDWLRIGFSDGSTGNLNNAIIEYGGRSTYASVQVDSGNVTVQNSVIRYSAAQGVRSKVWLTLLNNEFNNNADEAVRINNPVGGLDPVTLSGNTGQGNGRDVIFMEGNIPTSLNLGANPGLPFLIETTLTVDAGRTMTVGAGAQFEMGIAGQVSGALNVAGTLDVNGTSASPVVFTSVQESSGMANRGDWYRIYLQPGSTATLDYPRIYYAGAATSDLYAENSVVTLTNGDIGWSAGYGVYAKDSVLNMTGSVIHDNSWDGLRVLAKNTSLNPTLTNNTFSTNTLDAVNLRFESATPSTFTATGNSGSLNGLNGILLSGTLGDTTVSANPGLPYVIESLIVSAGHRMQINPGVIFKSSQALVPNGTLLQVYGELDSLGNENQPVVFTSLFDDAYGGSTVHDVYTYLPLALRGSRSLLSMPITNTVAIPEGLSQDNLPRFNLVANEQVARGDWRGIAIQPGGNANLSYTIIQYGGYPDIAELQVSHSTAVFDHLTVRYSSNHGIYSEDANLDLRNSVVSDNQDCGLRIYSEHNYIQPVVMSNTFNDNGTYAMYIILNGGGIGQGRIADNTGTGNGLVNGVYIEGTITDAVSHLDYNPNFPYVFWTIEIGAGNKITVAPGVVLKFIAPPDSPNFARGTGTALIDGSWESLGTAAQPIIFTSYWDDSAGGDTNGDGNATQPQPGDWLGFIVHAGGDANLRYTEFRYGGGNGWNAWADGGQITMSYSKVYYSAGNGIGGWGSVNISNSVIANNMGYGIQLNGPASVHQNSIVNNGQYGLVNYYTPDPKQDYQAPAENNYWGAPNGPSYDGGNCPYETPTGSGSMINCPVDWYPFLTEAP